MIKIEVTGNSIPEVADKLLAIGNSLRRTGLADANTAAAIAMQAERDAARPTLPEIIQAEAEKIATAKRTRKKAEPAPVTVVEDEPNADTVEAMNEVRTGGLERFDTVEAALADAAVPHIDEAMAATLKAVERVGRDKVVAILSQFGAAKARDVPEGQRAEYIKLLGDA